MKKIRVVELFAGVGGFRLGLEKAGNKTAKYEVSWSSQWEPGAKRQYASDIYISRFGNKNHSCEDIQVVVDKKFKDIPHHDLLVGGFPCQDYSVARTLSQADGLEGKKGVLWWSIYNILLKKGRNAPKFLFLENVDRLLKSPAKQRGRDFAIMLSSLASLGYAVEWRIINAADYGFPQRRRRVYILGYKKNTSIWKSISKCKDKKDWIIKDGVIAKAFKVKTDNIKVNEVEVGLDPVFVSNKFSKDIPSKSPFENSGVMINGQVFTAKVEADYKGKYSVLGDFIIDEEDVPEEFFIKDSYLKKWEYLKGGKKEERESKDGFKYFYSEGGMVFPDALDKPSRTIVTGEGGASPSRFKHVIRTKSGRLRRLTPIELEQLNMFPKNHTAGAPDVMRAFIMGNALVVGVIERIGKSLRDYM
jgi:DNA (cytosine-5)-methyltransferase 1